VGLGNAAGEPEPWKQDVISTTAAAPPHSSFLMVL
jgi:hypothetical protein